MSIGEFARRSRLSPKALRLYNELGLLPPARVDDDSGYRYYAESQLDRAGLIAALRQVLGEIPPVSDDSDGPSELGGSPILPTVHLKGPRSRLRLRDPNHLTNGTVAHCAMVAVTAVRPLADLPGGCSTPEGT
jgi:DNA-binding transcriptional MerR regulator